CRRFPESSSQLLRKRGRTGAVAPCAPPSVRLTAELSMSIWTSSAQAFSPPLESHCSMGATFLYGTTKAQSRSWLSTNFWPSGFLRSEEHTSELQSLAYLVCRLLLEKKKKWNLKSKSWRAFRCT